MTDDNVKVASQAERKCSRCGELVLVVYVHESLRPRLFDLEAAMILVPDEAGVFSVRRGQLEHDCSEEDHDG